MATIDILTKRNHDFAEQRFAAGLSLMPTLRTIVVSCADPRVDPAHLLGLATGEAAVLRNIGGRITPATIQSLGMLQMVARVAGAQPGGPMQLIVLHHTDCGIAHLAGNPALLAGYFGIDQAELAAKAIADPWASVAVDVAALKASQLLPRAWAVVGLVYDVATGLVETVVPSDSQEHI